MTHPLSEAGTSVEVKPTKFEREIHDAIISRLVSLTVGTCSCFTMSPELKFHTESCRYRIASEALELAGPLYALIQPTPAETEGKPIGFVDRNFLAAIKEQGRTEPLTIWAESYALEHVPIYASPTPPPIGDGEGDLVARLRHLVSLNEPRNGGPYQGVAAQACVKAMADAANAIESLSRQLEEAREAERKRAIAAIHWVFSADGTKTERLMADEAINKINDPDFAPAAPRRP